MKESSLTLVIATIDKFRHFRHFQISPSPIQYIKAIEAFIRSSRPINEMNADEFRLFFPLFKNYSQRSLYKKPIIKRIGNSKKKLNSTPQPYCELDCPWLCLCRIIIPPGCILTDLTDTSLWQEKIINSSGK